MPTTLDFDKIGQVEYIMQLSDCSGDYGPVPVDAVMFLTLAEAKAEGSLRCAQNPGFDAKIEKATWVEADSFIDPRTGDQWRDGTLEYDENFMWVLDGDQWVDESEAT
jgi:hypothetical protein